MGETIDSKKIRLVNYITAIQDESFLDLLEKLFERVPAAQDLNPDNSGSSVQASQTIADMIREQNYKGFDREKFDALIRELDIDDIEIMDEQTYQSLPR